jgi:hypothetical protein
LHFCLSRSAAPDQDRGCGAGGGRGSPSRRPRRRTPSRDRLTTSWSAALDRPRASCPARATAATPPRSGDHFPDDEPPACSRARTASRQDAPLPWRDGSSRPSRQVASQLNRCAPRTADRRRPAACRIQTAVRSMGRVDCTTGGYSSARGSPGSRPRPPPLRPRSVRHHEGARRRRASARPDGDKAVSTFHSRQPRNEGHLRACPRPSRSRPAPRRQSVQRRRGTSRHLATWRRPSYRSRSACSSPTITAARASSSTLQSRCARTVGGFDHAAPGLPHAMTVASVFHVERATPWRALCAALGPAALATVFARTAVSDTTRDTMSPRDEESTSCCRPRPDRGRPTPRGLRRRTVIAHPAGRGAGGPSDVHPGAGAPRGRAQHSAWLSTRTATAFQRNFSELSASLHNTLKTRRGQQPLDASRHLWSLLPLVMLSPAGLLGARKFTTVGAAWVSCVRRPAPQGDYFAARWARRYSSRALGRELLAAAGTGARRRRRRRP